MVFIGKVHRRRSDTSILDKNQSKNDTCHAPLMLPDNLLDVCTLDNLCIFNRQLIDVVTVNLVISTINP